ncbi:redoxin family protein [Actinomycetospora sp. CA-101289]|uniref:redoxin family protein n=1 Tax=Actinomycetospora sp. CA-101289 TaxID=3239893 RepID=UPI003D98E049
MTRSAELPVEGAFPSLDGATSWLNSAQLTPAGLRGKVVAVQFCTFSCINWLRTVPYVRAWDEAYREDGLVVIGAHSPEFAFEHDPEKVRSALAAMGIAYPVAVDDDFAIWRAFDNAYWPALYVIDAQGRIRYHHFGEEAYERSERAIRELLAEAGAGVGDDLVSVEPDGVYLAADWLRLGSPETYVGHARATGFASPGGLALDRSRFYTEPSQLRLNHWALSGRWTVRSQVTVLDEPGGRIVHRFRGRDVNLVMGGRANGEPVPFRVALDGGAPRGARGLDVDEDGTGIATEERLYQLIRQEGPTRERTVEITFADAGARAYVFTFG